jgi:hypothetical protein
MCPFAVYPITPADPVLILCSNVKWLASGTPCSLLVHAPERRRWPSAGLPGSYAASFALTRATVAAVQTAAPAGVGKPSAVSFAASARSDSDPLGSRREPVGFRGPLGVTIAKVAPRLRQEARLNGSWPGLAAEAGGPQSL